MGVLRDFNMGSLRNAIVPLALVPMSSNYNLMTFRMDVDHMSSTLEQVHKTFTRIYPYYMYDLSFLDERVELRKAFRRLRHCY